VSLLVKNAAAIVTCDDADRILKNASLYCEDGVVKALGGACPKTADEVLDGTGMLVYPGLVNTHHHLYQMFSRNIPQAQGLALFDWLRYLYKIWAGLNEDVVRLSTLCGAGQLLKYGCTTVFDHHYVFPQNCGDLIGAQFEAAALLGVRFAASRGSMDRSVKDGGLPPDSVVQTVDEILRDSRNLIEAYHDPRPGSMRTVALAPCSPFSVSAELMRQTAALARASGVRLHTHLGETRDEERWCLETVGMRPYDYLESLGWTGPDVWLAHCIYVNPDEIRRMAASGTGVAHCPVSNMKLSSGVMNLPAMRASGVKVSLAVDGSASNDGSDMLDELRCAYLVHRLTWGADAPDGYALLKTACRGGADVLGRSDIGSLQAGKCADFFLIDSRRLDLTGADIDPGALLASVGYHRPVDATVVGGKIVVRGGRLTGIDEEKTAAEARACVRRYLANL
jgi:cytosine/adenosine deaminase-related metal-dependent hydrolase